MTTLQDLKKLPQWVGWKTIQRIKKDGTPAKPTKLLMDANTGKAASSNDPGTWSTAKVAWSAAKRYGWDGLGFVFTIQAGIVGVDLDNCFADDRRNVEGLRPWARDIVACLDSYTEFSPSGNGLHILCKGQIEQSFNKKLKAEDWPQSSQDWQDGMVGGVEMYDSLRYFTVTGKRFCGTPETINERTQELEAIRVTFADDYVPQKTAVSLNVPQNDYDKPSVQQVRDMLATLPVSGDYLWWVAILAAVHDVYPDSTGVQLVEEWSPGYKNEVAKKFESFKREGGNKATIATLIWEASKRGYRFAANGKPPQTSKRKSKSGAVSMAGVFGSYKRDG